MQLVAFISRRPGGLADWGDVINSRSVHIRLRTWTVSLGRHYRQACHLPRCSIHASGHGKTRQQRRQGLPRAPTGSRSPTVRPLLYSESIISEDHTSFTEGCPGANKKAVPPGRHQEQTSKQRCTFSPLRSVQFSSVQPSLGIILFLRSLCSKFSRRFP